MAKTLRMTVALPELLNTAAQEIGNPGISVGFSIAVGCLNRICRRAIDLQDPVLISELNTIGWLKYSSEEEEGRVEAAAKLLNGRV